MKIWLDDLRPAPNGWKHVLTVKEAIEHLKLGNVSEISLDNDLGLPLEEGYDVIVFLEKTIFSKPEFAIPTIHIHTSNPVARKKMEAGISSIQKIFENIHKFEQINQIFDSLFEDFVFEHGSYPNQEQTAFLLENAETNYNRIKSKTK